jgi:hypothetical protein
VLNWQRRSTYGVLLSFALQKKIDLSQFWPTRFSKVRTFTQGPSLNGLADEFLGAASLVKGFSFTEAWLTLSLLLRMSLWQL